MIPNNAKSRLEWIDTLKLFAIFHVFLKHFVSRWHKEYASFWQNPPVSWLLKGVTGKCCVAFLGVCLGYFAYKNAEKNPSVYIVKRYLYFFICGLFINTLRTALHAIGLLNLSVEINGIWDALGTVGLESLQLGRKLFVTFWCMLPFFCSSVLAYINGRAKVGLIGLLVQIAFCWILNQVWIAVCMIGAVIAVLEKEKYIGLIFSKWYIRIIATVIILIIIKRPETNVTYLIDGICSGMLILIISFFPGLQRGLSIRFFSSQGKNLMAIFLIHTTVYNVIGKWLFDLFSFSDYSVSFLTVGMCCWVIIVLLSYPITYMINRIMNLLTKPIRKYSLSAST